MGKHHKRKNPHRKKKSKIVSDPVYKTLKLDVKRISSKEKQEPFSKKNKKLSLKEDQTLKQREEWLNFLNDNLHCVTHPDLLYVIQQCPSYTEYVNYLLNKNGIVPEDYVILTENGSYHKNSRIAKEGYEVHHIYENQIANLSQPHFFPLIEVQRAGALVYANYIEHALLHYLIYKEDIPNYTLGIGGLVNHGMLYRLKATKLLSDTEYEIFCTLLKIVLPSNIDCIERASTDFHFLTKEYLSSETIIQKADGMIGYGITQISPAEYNKITENPIGSILKCKISTIHVLRSPHDAFMFIGENTTTHRYYLLKGGQVMNLQHNPEWYYEKLDKACALFYSIYERALTIIKPIQDYIRACGGSGHLNGMIIDYDDFNHVKIDFAKSVIIPYYAKDITSRHVSSDGILNTYSLPAGQTQYLSPVLDSLEMQYNLIGISTSLSKEFRKEASNDKKFYTDNRIFKAMQRVQELKIITLWLDEMEEEDYWARFHLESNAIKFLGR